jgi:uncharacterized protein
MGAVAGGEQGLWALNNERVWRHSVRMDTEMHVTPSGDAEILTVAQCWSQLRDGFVGRLAVQHEGRPDIFPVNYVVDRGSLVFRTGSGTLFATSAGADVAFEVDGYDAVDATAWSVVVRGTARELRDLDDTLDALRLPLFPWHEGPKPRIVRIEPDSVSGRRFTVRGGHRDAGTGA